MDTSSSIQTFRLQIDVTFVFAVSILSFPNIFCSGNLFRIANAGRCNFNNIDVISDIETIGTVSFGNFTTTQIIMNKDDCYLQNNTNQSFYLGFDPFYVTVLYYFSFVNFKLLFSEDK